MPERFSGTESFPKERRYEHFPIIDEGELVHIPREVRQEIAKQGLSDATIVQAAVSEFQVDLSVPPGEEARFRSNPEVLKAADTYLDLLKARREIRAEVARLREAAQKEQETGLTGLSSLLSSASGATVAAEELVVLEAQQKHIEKDFRNLKQALARTFKEPGRSEYVDLRKDRKETRDVTPLERVETKPIAFSLMRRGDALRKERAYRREIRELEGLARKAELVGEMVGIRQSLEAMREGADAPSERDLLLTHFSEDLTTLADRLVEEGLVKGPKEGVSEDETRAIVRNDLADSVLTLPADVLRKRYDEMRSKVASAEADWNRRLENPMNAELAELLRDREVEELLRAYHVERHRFIPVGDIKTQLEDAQRVVNAARGPILRELLYGPPGTGKTEIFREIGRRNGQKVRVISLHEHSTFETLVGTHQIPLPKSETVADAERFWERIDGKSGAEIANELPEAVLAEFSGDTPEKKAEDFRGWFAYKLKAARAAAALGAVSPDDPRVKKAQQEALAAWLDQPLAEGLENGDLIVLDEVDRAGSGLEGLQDLLTRRPGDEFQPAGRPKPFRIHKRARVVMTANWGDLGTELSGGRGTISSPIASRVLEKRKVDYPSAETEMKLLELMTSTPEGASHLSVSEHASAKALVGKIFPKLRANYLQPDGNQVLTPVSVRTLENIVRRLVDETTRTRVRGKDGQPVHFLEAAWAEIAAGPFREDQREQALSDLAKTCVAQGLFEPLKRLNYSVHYAPHQLVARLTGQKEQDMRILLPPPAGVGTQPLPKNFSLGSILAVEPAAQNAALYGPVRVRSFKQAIAESHAPWFRRIKELGGTPEIQKRFEAVFEAFDVAGIEARKKYRDDPTKWVPEAMQAIEASVSRLPKFDQKELQALIGLLADRYELNGADQDTLLASGVPVSALINRFFEQGLPAGTDLTLDMKAAPGLDFLGYGLKKGKVILRGDVGDYAGAMLRGGALEIGRVGDKLGLGMEGGTINALQARDYAGQSMKGGVLSLTETGDRLGFKMGGGQITVNKAGDNVGQEASGGRILVRERAGERLGEGAYKNAQIDFAFATSVDYRTGATVAQLIDSRRKEIVSKGVRRAAPTPPPRTV